MSKQPFTKVTLLFEAITRTEDYYEDDFGQECLTLNSVHKVEFVEETNITTAGRKYMEVMESNADDPPYSEVKFIMAWYSDSKEIIPVRHLEYEYEQEQKRKEDKAV